MNGLVSKHIHDHDHTVTVYMDRFTNVRVFIILLNIRIRVVSSWWCLCVRACGRAWVSTVGALTYIHHATHSVRTSHMSAIRLSKPNPKWPSTLSNPTVGIDGTLASTLASAAAYARMYVCVAFAMLGQGLGTNCIYESSSVRRRVWEPHNNTAHILPLRSIHAHHVPTVPRSVSAFGRAKSHFRPAGERG